MNPANDNPADSPWWATVQRIVTLRVLVRGALLLAGLALVGWVVAAGHAQFADHGWIDDTVRRRGGTGVGLFVGIGAIAIAAGLPRQVLSAAAGYAFGIGWGLAWAMTASLLGCAGAFTYARALARAPLRRRFPDRVRRLDAFLKEHPIKMTIMVRFLPGNNLLTNLAAGVSSVPPLPFFVGSLLGYLPQTLIFALLGSSPHGQMVWRLTSGITLFFVSTLVGVVLYRRQRGRAGVQAP